MEIIDNTEQTAQQEIPEAASLTLEQVPEVPIKDETESGLPQNIAEFGDKIKFEISKMHEPYKISIETEHENKLAKQIRDVYCQLSTIKKTQAVILAQSNGILAASALGLPICTRLQGFGQAMTLQQCETKRIFISANESKCGFQPFFNYEDKNCTIGVDRWSIHPYSGCFWKTHLVNLNGFHHTWEHNSTDGEWVKQKASIHMPNLDLITEFEELHLNDFDYSLKSHPAHETMEMEQLNILNDLVGLIKESNSKSVSDIVMSEKQDNQIETIFSWFDTLKILILSIIGLIIFIVCLRILIICDPFTRIMKKIRQTRRLRRYGNNREEAHELTSVIGNSSTQPPEEIIEQPFTRMTAPTPLTMERPTQSRPAQPSAPKQRGIYPIIEENWDSDQARKCTGKHTTCTHVVGYGMNSEDAVQHNEASDSESQPETNYLVIESDIETESEAQRDGLFGDYGFYPPTRSKGRNKKVYHPEIGSRCNGQTIAHRAAAENNKLLIRILRYHKYKFSSYNSLGETPLMVAIAYGHEEVASYLWISSNVAQMAKDNSTVLHYAAKHGNNTLARAACERKIRININQTTRPGNYTALHLATMYRQDHIVNILLEHGAYPDITDVNGNTPRDILS
ncbi:hypothetical protein OUZ56_012401 [Daphnia magna]|uniref:Ankyrin repeat domain-containing protein n=1 Tax=Daphnia magna TaxID=35525 RepID=A0ABQ9Z313_9CRUS|nr:hypothetical protein OUZ56_012401 [Daphnia magna]